MVNRIIEGHIQKLWKHFPVVSVNGPRQSGKTTLIRNLFKALPYQTMEDPEILQLSENDPRRFLESFPKGAIFDEVQRSPHLFSYIQGIVDADPKKRFVLSGSQNFLMSERISQTLAGRVGIATLLPFSYQEIKSAKIKVKNLEDLLFRGGYPRLYDRKIPADIYFPNYVSTYLERDVKQIKNIGDLSVFTRFIKLCAGRAGQLLNLTSLSNDAGISVNTVKSWLSILEASYIVFMLQPHHTNFNKRLTKTPKIYFYDTGLLCYLSEIKKASQLNSHYNRGGVFENFVIAELIKKYYNQGKRPNLNFWQNNHGKEIDLIVNRGNRLTPVEIKSSVTMNPKQLDNIDYWHKLSKENSENGYVIYAGDQDIRLSRGTMLSWKTFSEKLKI